MADLKDILENRDTHGHEQRYADCDECFPFGLWEAEIDRSAKVERYEIRGGDHLLALVFSARDANFLVDILNRHAVND